MSHLHLGTTTKEKQIHNRYFHISICARVAEDPYLPRGGGDRVALSIWYWQETHHLLSLTASLGSLVNEIYQLSVYL